MERDVGETLLIFKQSNDFFQPFEICKQLEWCIYIFKLLHRKHSDKSDVVRTTWVWDINPLMPGGNEKVAHT